MRKAFYLLIAVLTLATVSAVYGQTFIRASLPNPADQPATGYHFQILTPGEVLDAVAQIDAVDGRTGDPRFIKASLPDVRPGKPIQGIAESPAHVSLAFDHPVNSGQRIDLRVAFKPQEYWKVYFNDVFEYPDGHTERSHIPYAAFFISYEPTSDVTKKKAALTVVNNISSTYGIPKSVKNDDQRRPITFHNARVFINNSMDHYDLAHFDKPSGTIVDLPSEFTLAAGEAQTFDLGLVEAHTYVLTFAEVSYQGEKERYPIACSHPDGDSTEAKVDAVPR